MCQQSLINYLEAELESKVKKEAIEFLILEGEKYIEHLKTAKDKKEANENYRGDYKEKEHFIVLKKHASEIDKSLSKIKVCDPAVGSGAFPVGMMTEIIKSRMFFVETGCLENIYTNSRQEEVKRTTYNYKRDCIEHSLYGVDIDPGAVEIAKLRLWLSLMVDEDDIKNIKPLPNLDYKIVCGNSLLGVEKNLFNLDLFNELEKLKPIYFNETNPTKKRGYKNQIDKLISEITNGHAEFDFEVYFSEVFHHKDGFDVVIANPPYGNIFTNKEKSILRNIFHELQFKIDAYSVFILKGVSLNKNNGYLIYIIPSTFMDNYFEEKVRRKLLIENSIDLLIELDDNIFKSAVVHSMILAVNKKSPNPNHQVRSSYSNDLTRDKQLIQNDYFLKQSNTSLSIRTFEQSAFIEKLKRSSINLNKVIDIRQAIKSGNDSKYISTKKINKSYKPILGGKHINKWVKKDPKLFIFYGKHLACPREYKIFEQPKILIREAGKEIIAIYDEENFYIMSSLYNAILVDYSYSLKYVLALLNSNLFQFLMKLKTFNKTKGAFTKAKIYHYYDLPVKVINM